MDRVAVTTALLPDGFLSSGDDITEQLNLKWARLKAALIVPPLKLAVVVCLVMATMLLIERAYMAVVVLFVKLSSRKAEKRYKWEHLKADFDLEKGGSANCPMVLVQIPMYNEKEVYRLSIGAACGLSWPPDRIMIQVLDDSSDPAVQALVEAECKKWERQGVNIKYEFRDNRHGYKAGALRDSLNHSYVKLCDYVAIFDADFQPEPDFLWRTVPFLVHNPQLALVQAGWKYVNSDDFLITRLQEISLDYHFEVEQEMGSSTCAFFGFNGSGGVWRLAAIDDAGGWKDRTIVEDMDLAVRASLRGWKFVYLGSIKVKNELPSSFKAYRHQQQRWSCGPANLFRKMAGEIMRNKKVTMWKKIYVIYSFFLVRKIIAHLVTFLFYCVVLPATVLVPEVQVPKWGAVYIPCAVTLLIAVGTPRSLHLLIFWALFENVMSFHRTKATFIGLLESSRVYEWIVTEKLGDIAANKRPNLRIRDRVHLQDLGAGAYLFLCACCDVAYGKNRYYIFLFTQAVAFFIAGFGYIGNFLPNS